MHIYLVSGLFLWGLNRSSGIFAGMVSPAWKGGGQHVWPALPYSARALASVSPPSSQREKRQFSRSIFDERLLPILHSDVIFSISGLRREMCGQGLEFIKPGINPEM